MYKAQCTSFCNLLYVTTHKSKSNPSVSPYLLIYLVSIGVLPALCPWDEVRFPETEVPDSCELACGCQPVLVTTKPSVLAPFLHLEFSIDPPFSSRRFYIAMVQHPSKAFSGPLHPNWAVFPERH